MNKEEILNALKEGKQFSGRNGAFNGIMTPKTVDESNNVIDVECSIDGKYKWEEHWDDLDVTIYAFERGDYFFI